jgi:transposase
MHRVESGLQATPEHGIGGIAIDRKAYQDAVERLAEMPGLGVDSAQQIIAEVGPTAASPSGKCLSSWVGVCPGTEETAGVNYGHRSPKGNRHMRRLLNQAANAGARTKGSIFEIVYRRTVPRLGHNQKSEPLPIDSAA